MNSKTKQKIRSAVYFISQHPECAHIARPFLDPTIQKLIDILDQLKDGMWKTAEEIAISLGMHRETVRQMLKECQWNFLDGGITLLSSSGNQHESGWQLPNGKIAWQPPADRLKTKKSQG